MRGLLLTLLAGCSASTFAQWDVPTHIVLDGATPEQRQVTGLSSPASSSAGVSAEAERTNATHTATASGTNALTIALAPPIAAYTPGLRVNFFPSATNTGDATLNVDGLGAIALRKDVNVALDSGDLRPGMPMQAVYDGAVFQLVNQLYRACPLGFSTVNRDICIADLPNDSLNWYAAVLTCVNQGARLCTMQEWIQGCKTLPAFAGTISTYEWVDSAANSTNYAKNMGWLPTNTVGNCTDGSRQVTTALHRSRCCYDR